MEGRAISTEQDQAKYLADLVLLQGYVICDDNPTTRMVADELDLTKELGAFSYTSYYDEVLCKNVFIDKKWIRSKIG